MAPKTLIDKIEALPREKKAAAEDFVEFLATRQQGVAPGGLPAEFLRRIDERRERLRKQYGLYDSVATIRELRDNGD